MNVKKYLTWLAGAALLCACTDDVAVGPDTGTGGQGTASGSITFRVDGLVGGSTEQTTKAGGTVIANAAENEIKVLDILVFAFSEDNSTLSVPGGGATGNIGDATHWKLQEWHYYSVEEITTESDPFFRPVPSTAADQANCFHRFPLLGSGAYRVATISPAVGLATGATRYLRFVMVANGGINKTLMAKEGFLDATGTNCATVKTLDDFNKSGLPLFTRGATIQCPLPMVATFAQTGGNDYIAPDGTTAAYTLNATLRHAVARFDIVNLTPDNFTLTKIETLQPVDGSVSMTTLHPNASGAPYYATDKVTVNIPTLTQVDADGNLLWKAGSGDARVLNSAFYTTPSTQDDVTDTAVDQKMSLKVYGKNGNQEVNKEIDLIIPDDPGPGNSYNINPNTRYRLNVTYYGGIQATMEVVEWNDDYLNPDLITAQTPVVKIPENQFTSDNFDLTTGIRPYSGWYWEENNTATIPYTTSIPLTDMAAAQTLSFDMVTEYEAAEFPFDFQIVNALHPNQPDNVWLRTVNPLEYGGVIRDATDPKLWHINLIAQEGKVSDLKTLDPLKIRIYSKENPENYTFIDVVQPAEYLGLKVYWTADGSTTPHSGAGTITITDLSQPLNIYFPNNVLGIITVKRFSQGKPYGGTYTNSSSPLSFNHNPQPSYQSDFRKIDRITVSFENLPGKTLEYALVVKE